MTLYTSWGQPVAARPAKVPDMASILTMKRNRKQAQKRRRRQAHAAARD